MICLAMIDTVFRMRGIGVIVPVDMRHARQFFRIFHGGVAGVLYGGCRLVQIALQQDGPVLLRQYPAYTVHAGIFAGLGLRIAVRIRRIYCMIDLH